MNSDKNTQDKFRRWCKLVTGLTKDNLVERNGEVYSAIITTFKNKNTIKAHLSALAKLLKERDSDLYHKYSKEATQINKQVEMDKRQLDKIIYCLQLDKQ